jgi:hypothetical protein
VDAADESEDVGAILSTSRVAVARVPDWERRLSLSEKLRRALVIALALLTAVAVVFGPGLAHNIAAFAARPVSASVPQQPAGAQTGPEPSPLGAWQRLGVPDADNQPLTFTPSPTDPSTIYACGVGSSQGSSQRNAIALGPLRVWRTQNGGATWQSLPLPRFAANQCDLRVAPAAPSRLTLLAMNTGCQTYVAFFSGDAGATWKAITLPFSQSMLPYLQECAIFATTRHLYLWYTFEDPARAYADRAAFLRSDDGQRWTSAAGGLPAGALFYVISGGAPTAPAGDDVFLASAADSLPAAVGVRGAALWWTADAGSSWRRVGSMPGDGPALPIAAVHSGASALSSALPLYVTSRSSDPGAPATLQLFETRDGFAWAALPPLPIAGVTPERSGVLRVFGADPSGRLFVLGAAPAGIAGASTAPASPQPTRWLWIWDSNARRWRVLPDPLPDLGSPDCPTLCWQLNLSWGPASGLGQGAYVWAATVPHTGNTLLRMFVSVPPRTGRTGGGNGATR